MRVDEAEEDRAVRAKILRLAGEMLYDDDVEESTVTANREKVAERPKPKIT